MPRISQLPQGSSRNVTTDGQGRTVYYNPLLKRSFYLQPGDLRAFSNLQARHMIAVAVGAIVWTLSKSVLAAVLVGLGVGVALTLVFYYGFLTRLDLAENDPDREKRLSPAAFAFGSIPREKAAARAALSVIAGFLVLFNARQAAFAGAVLTLNYILAAAAFAFGAFEAVLLAIGIIRSR